MLSAGLHGPALLDAVPAHLPTLHAARVVLVVPEGAARADALFGVAPLWTGVGAAAHAATARRVYAERIAPAPWAGVS